MAQYKHRKCIQKVIVIMILNMLAHKVQAITPYDCDISRDRGLFTRKCENLGLTTIPYFDFDIEFIILIDNPIKTITRGNFKAIKRLKVFHHLNIELPRTELKIESNAFADSPELYEIELFRVNLSFSGSVILPMRIESLKVTQSLLRDNVFDFSTSENLKYLDLGDNNLTVMPKFHKYAPLEFVSLKNNFISITPLSQIVRYCKLRKYYINFKLNNVYTTTGNDKCECRRWKEWFLVKRIEGYFQDEGIQCPSKEPCNEPLFSQQWELQNDNCLHNKRDPSYDVEGELHIPPSPSPPAPNINSSIQLQPANVTPAIEQKSTSKILYFLLLVLMLVVLLETIGFYLIYFKRRQSEPEFNQEEVVPEQDAEEDVEIVEE